MVSNYELFCFVELIRMYKNSELFYYITVMYLLNTFVSTFQYIWNKYYYLVELSHTTLLKKLIEILHSPCLLKFSDLEACLFDSSHNKVDSDDF